MITCPKCGSDRITGPRYIKYAFWFGGSDALRYICSVCGYLKDEPTRDRAKR